MNDPKVPNETLQPEPSATKQPYEEPAVIYRAPLEAVAGYCGPSPNKAAFECSEVNFS